MENHWLFLFVLICLRVALADKPVRAPVKGRAPISQYTPTDEPPAPSSSKSPPFLGIKGRRPSSTTPPPPPETPTPSPQPLAVDTNEVQYQQEYQQFIQLSEEEKQQQLQQADEDLNKHLLQALEDLKDKLKSGMEESDYEVLDPLALDDMNLKPIVAGEEFDVRMEKLTLGGIAGYDITQLESQLSESRFKLGLYYPKLYANCLFDANGTLYDIFKVTGKGNATLIFKEVHARTVIYLSKENGSLEATSADQPYVDFSSAEILFRDDTVKGSEPIKAESVATQLGPLYFWVLTAKAVEKIDYPLALYLNDALRKFELPLSLKMSPLRQRHLRVHVPNNPIPYAYVSSNK